MADQIDQLVFSAVPSGGHFTLSYNSHTTSNLAYNADNPTIATALAALTGIGSTANLSISGGYADGPSQFIHFTGSLALQAIGPLTATSSLTGAGIAPEVNEQTLGMAPGTVQNEVQFINGFATGTNSPATSGNWTLFGQTLAWNATAAQVQAVVDAFLGPIFGTGAVVVSGGFNGSAAGDYTLAYPVGGSIALVTVARTTLAGAGGSITPIATHAVTGNYLPGGASEVQILTVDSNSTGGNFGVVGPIATESVAYNASASTLATAINAAWAGVLPTFTVSGSSGGPYTITFGDEAPHPLLVATAGTLARNVGLTVNVVAIGGVQFLRWIGNAPPIAQVDEWTIAANDPDTTYTFAVNGKPVSVVGDPLGASATATDIVTAWGNALYPEAGEITVANSGAVLTFTGPSSGEPFIVTASTSGGLGTISSATHVTLPSGPNWLNLPGNWSLGQNPGNGDQVSFDTNAVSVLYGLDQLSGTLLGSLSIAASYVGNIGLHDVNGANQGAYEEYRPKTLLIGATTARIGYGSGPGSSLVRWDTGTATTTIEVFGTGNPTDNNPAFIYTNGASSPSTATMQITKGYVGVAPLAGQVAQATVTFGYQTSPQSDVDFYSGPGATLGNINMSGGTVEIHSPVASATLTGGTLTVGRDGGISTALTIWGQTTCFYCAASMPTACSVGPQATLDTAQDMGAKTASATAIQVHKGGTVNDPFGTLTIPLWLPVGCTAEEVNVNIGPNRQIGVVPALPTPPTAPSAVSVSPVPGMTSSMTISWTSNSGGAETYFELQRSPDETTWTVAGFSPTGRTQWDEPQGTLLAGNEYYYRVCAVIVSDGGTVESDWSSTQNGDTTATLTQLGICTLMASSSAISGTGWGTSTLYGFDTAEISDLNNGANSQALDCTGFLQNPPLSLGFSIPTGATIKGVVASITWEDGGSQTDEVTDQTIKLLKAGTAAGSNRASGAALPLNPTYAPQTYGTTTDLWGTTLNPSDVNNSGFGLQIALVSSHDAAAPFVAYVFLTVHYEF